MAILVTRTSDLDIRASFDSNQEDPGTFPRFQALPVAAPSPGLSEREEVGGNGAGCLQGDNLVWVCPLGHTRLQPHPSTGRPRLHLAV